MASPDPRAQEVITCDLCSKAVEFFCKPCHVRLCQECVVKHMLSQQSKDHNVVLFRERESEPLHPKCQKHTDMRCELHCKTCDVPICSKCVIGPHDKHKFMDLVDNITAKIRRSIEADTTELEETIIPTYEKKEFESANEISLRKQKYSNIQSEIDEHGAKWHREIDKIVKKQKSESKVMEKQDLDRLEKQHSEWSDKLSLARDVLKRNKDLLKSKNPKQIKNYKSRNKELSYVPPTGHWNLPSFVPVKLQGDHLYRQFGELKAALESEIKGYKIKNFASIEVVFTTQTPKDRLWNLCYTHLDKMWISGREGTIDLIDLQGTVLETVKTVSGKKPQGLTSTTDGHLIFGDYIEGTINLMKSGKTNTIITFSSQWSPRDLCFTLSGDLLVTMYNADLTENKIVRYNKDYKPKQEIQYDREGNPLFKAGRRSWYIAENKNFDICMSNGNSKSIVTVNQNGELRWKYTGNLESKVYNEFYPEGISTDSQFNVLVADCTNHCIHVTDLNGKFLFYIQSKLTGPCALSIDNEDRLFVGESTTGDDAEKIKVIKYLK